MDVSKYASECPLDCTALYTLRLGNILFQICTPDTLKYFLNCLPTTFLCTLSLILSIIHSGTLSNALSYTLPVVCLFFTNYTLSKLPSIHSSMLQPILQYTLLTALLTILSSICPIYLKSTFPNSLAVCIEICFRESSMYTL